jgi:hypothetical protein
MRREPVKIFSQFTDEDRKRLGPPKTPEAFSTEHHEYVSPFNYVNVTLGNFAEYDTQTGMESSLKRDSLLSRSSNPS